MIEIIGGPDRDRTGDLFHAMEARSQLRHRPTPIYSRVGRGLRQTLIAQRLPPITHVVHKYRGFAEHP